MPPEVADAAASVGYTACTHATNHSWDQGADGIARLWDTLASKGIAQTGSYKTEEDSTKPLVIDSPTGGGKLGLVTGTVSLNGMTADHDWQVDRLREAGDPQHQSDIDRAVAKAKAAREQGAERGGHGHAFGAGIHRRTPIRGRSPRRMSSRTPARST